MKIKANGFTLMELMITVSIIAILGTVAYPSYLNQVRRSHRTEGRDALLQIQLAQEKYFLSNNSYGTLANLNVPGLVLVSSKYYSPNQYYEITVTPTTPTTTFTATAAAKNGQLSDGHCATLSITETGDKSGSTNADCWTR